jgi:hypothetical protein
MYRRGMMRNVGLGQLRVVEGGPIDYTETASKGDRKHYARPFMIMSGLEG